LKGSDGNCFIVGGVLSVGLFLGAAVTTVLLMIHLFSFKSGALIDSKSFDYIIPGGICFTLGTIVLIITCCLRGGKVNFQLNKAIADVNFHYFRRGIQWSVRRFQRGEGQHHFSIHWLEITLAPPQQPPRRVFLEERAPLLGTVTVSHTPGVVRASYVAQPPPLPSPVLIAAAYPSPQHPQPQPAYLPQQPQRQSFESYNVSNAVQPAHQPPPSASVVVLPEQVDSLLVNAFPGAAITPWTLHDEKGEVYGWPEQISARIVTIVQSLPALVVEIVVVPLDQDSTYADADRPVLSWSMKVLRFFEENNSSVQKPQLAVLGTSITAAAKEIAKKNKIRFIALSLTHATHADQID